MEASKTFLKGMSRYIFFLYTFFLIEGRCKSCNLCGHLRSWNELQAWKPSRVKLPDRGFWVSGNFINKDLSWQLQTTNIWTYHEKKQHCLEFKLILFWFSINSPKYNTDEWLIWFMILFFFLVEEWDVHYLSTLMSY